MPLAAKRSELVRVVSAHFVRFRRINAIALPKNADRKFLPLGAFLKRLRRSCHYCLAGNSACRISAFSTLSTSSTAPLLHCLKTSFNCRYLASCRFGMRVAFAEECNRVTDAPESTRRLSGHIPPTEQRPASGAPVTRLKRKLSNHDWGERDDEANIYSFS